MDGQCFVGVWKLPDNSATNNIYYFGTPFLEQYYTSFSLAPYETDPTSVNYLYVGIGQICPTANLGDIVFNQKYDKYNANKINFDKSTPIPDASVDFKTDLVNTCLPTPVDDDDIIGPVKDEGSSLGIIIGASVGGVVLLTAVVLGIYCFKKNKGGATPGDSDKMDRLLYKGPSGIQQDDSFNGSSSKGNTMVSDPGFNA